MSAKSALVHCPSREARCNVNRVKATRTIGPLSRSPRSGSGLPQPGIDCPKTERRLHMKNVNLKRSSICSPSARLLGRMLAVSALMLALSVIPAVAYGGRQASMLGATEPGLVDGLLLLSYPLHPSQRPMSYERSTSRASEPLRCSSTARGMGSAPSMRWWRC
jgi:hypothetical protein